MARPKKTNIEYFPHDVDASSRKTLTILESRWGNDGYAFWFKLLELLGAQDGMYIDARNPADMMFLAAKTGVSAPDTAQSAPETVRTILGCLAELGAICPSLWNIGIIFSEGLATRTRDAFRKRVDQHPQKEGLWRKFGILCDISAPKTPETENNPAEEIGKGKEEREIGERNKSSSLPEGFSETCRKVRTALCKTILSATDLEVIKSWADFTDEKITLACATAKDRRGKSVAYIDTILREEHDKSHGNETSKGKGKFGDVSGDRAAGFRVDVG